MSMGFESRPSCELCGSEKGKVIFSRPFTDPVLWEYLDRYYEHRLPRAVVEKEGYEVRHCPQCGFIWQSRVLDGEGMEALYGRWIDARASLAKRTSATVAYPRMFARDVARISSLVQKDPARVQVLDFGMGWGHWCLMAKAFGYQVAGVELSEERVAYARDVLGIRVVPSLADVPNGSVDYVHCEQVLEHVRDPLAVLRDLVSRLTPSGYVRIGVPDGSHALRELRSASWCATKGPLQPLEHINTFTPKTLVALAARAGLVLKKMIPLPLGRTENLVDVSFLPDALYLSLFRTHLLFQKVLKH
jgi:SAM-dependent methyltransferase